jgi:hypothetical protein
MGLSISEFEEMTPYELNLFAEAFVEKETALKEEKLTLVWLGEYYHRIKRLPSLKSEVEKLTGKKHLKDMSDEEMLKMVEKLNETFGGTVKEQGGENHGVT